jgi:hypothetical protein
MTEESIVIPGQKLLEPFNKEFTVHLIVDHDNHLVRHDYYKLLRSQSIFFKIKLSAA